MWSTKREHVSMPSTYSAVYNNINAGTSTTQVLFQNCFSSVQSNYMINVLCVRVYSRSFACNNINWCYDYYHWSYCSSRRCDVCDKTIKLLARCFCKLLLKFVQTETRPSGFTDVEELQQLLRSKEVESWLVYGSMWKSVRDSKHAHNNTRDMHCKTSGASLAPYLLFNVVWILNATLAASDCDWQYVVERIWSFRVRSVSGF
jgi:hypothetical protein